MNFTSKKNLKIFIFVLVAVITLGVGYAAITAITLNINGGGSASAVQENFNVHFVNEENVTPTMTQGTGEAKVLSDTVASLSVTGLTKKGDTAKAVYTVINESNGVGAEISLGLTNSNTEYFKVTEKINDTQIKAGETTIVTITVELIKTPIEDGIETTIQGILEASPIENDNVTGNNQLEISGTSNTEYVFTALRTAIGDISPSGDGVIVGNFGNDELLRLIDTYGFHIINKHVVVNGLIGESYVVFDKMGHVYYLRGGVDESELDEKPIYDANVQTLKDIFGNNWSDYCLEENVDDNDREFGCFIVDEWDAHVSDNGYVNVVNIGQWGCQIQNDGLSRCTID